MRRTSKLAAGVACLGLAYVALLVGLGSVLESRVEGQVREQLAHTLRADSVVIDDIELRLVRGTVVLKGIKASRSGIGTADLLIDKVELDIAPLGWALFDKDARRLEVWGANLDLSAAGAAILQRSPKPRRLNIAKFIVHDSNISLAVTSLFPSLGKVELEVEEARARGVSLHNSMSWLYRSEVLDAELALPASVNLVVKYRDGKLSVGGGIMGATPIVIPFSWPTPDPSKLELSQILSLIKTLVKELGPQLAKRKLESAWDEIVDVF